MRHTHDGFAAKRQHTTNTRKGAFKHAAALLCGEMMGLVSASAIKEQGPDADPVLDHILECDICLSIIADLTLPASLCETTCPELRQIIDGKSYPGDGEAQ